MMLLVLVMTSLAIPMNRHVAPLGLVGLRQSVHMPIRITGIDVVQNLMHPHVYADPALLASPLPGDASPERP